MKKSSIKTKAKAAPRFSRSDDVCLALFKDGVSLAVVDFTEAEFKKIQAQADQAGQTLDQLLLRTANAMVAGAKAVAS